MNIISGYTGTGKFAQPTPTAPTTADNGLNISSPQNVELGGSLIQDTTINGINSFGLVLERMTQFQAQIELSPVKTQAFQVGPNEVNIIGYGGAICPVLQFDGIDVSGPVSFKPLNNVQDLTAFVINQYWQIQINGNTCFIPLGIPT